MIFITFILYHASITTIISPILRQKRGHAPLPPPKPPQRVRRMLLAAWDLEATQPRRRWWWWLPSVVLFGLGEW